MASDLLETGTGGHFLVSKALQLRHKVLHSEHGLPRRIRSHVPNDGVVVTPAGRLEHHLELAVTEHGLEVRAVAHLVRIGQEKGVQGVTTEGSPEGNKIGIVRDRDVAVRQGFVKTGEGFVQGSLHRRHKLLAHVDLVTRDSIPCEDYVHEVRIEGLVLGRDAAVHHAAEHDALVSRNVHPYGRADGVEHLTVDVRHDEADARQRARARREKAAEQHDGKDHEGSAAPDAAGEAVRLLAEGAVRICLPKHPAASGAAGEDEQNKCQEEEEEQAGLHVAVKNNLDFVEGAPIQHAREDIAHLHLEVY
mmetsp:Transcript_109042/g.273222  ORF Transcript_109042/g.273222 Transcript_109042/m.273222 type:complete len:306 (+) Transcript_109042:739-1656(+)